ncbi:MAG: lipoate--protein ligase family protein [Trichloromonas sp.]|jgi:lipoate-protein ligase A|nr:lipoate--protein ligase family protein [Trichloromonas sp.]
MDDNRWRLVRTGPLPGGMNMALDEVLLQEVAAGRSRPVLRLYRWRPEAVSLGYFQRNEVVNRAFCRSSGIDVVRRLTGGRAVLHGEEVTYAVIAGSGQGFPVRAEESYRTIAELLRATLCSLGIEAELAPAHRQERERALPAACFEAAAGYELLCRGQKIAGSAQKRRGDFFLLQGSIPLELDPRRLFQVLNPHAAESIDLEAGAARLRRRVGWLNRYLPRPLTIDAVEERLRDVFAQGLGFALHEEPVRPGEWTLAENLTKERYDNPDWTWRVPGPGR